ncbi:COMM domain-containing protein 2 isoform X1 [Macrobrachium rosenbergii]|uniref:COMM domain-containing protein 2 isoform X1 n=1 Tax=Macrobrachium rosenbergii TaxID=79674 RepID=UPI0034D4A50A
MPLTISDDHKDQLSLLLTQDIPVIHEFCRLAGLFLQQEVNPRVFSSAANKLGVQPSQVEEAIQALVFLLNQSARTSVSQEEFKTLAVSLGFSTDAADVLTNAYLENDLQLKEYLKRMGVQVPLYQNLEWRFDILVGSRALHHIAEPLVTLQLSLDKASSEGNCDTNSESPMTKSDNRVEKLLLQTDPNNLLHMTAVLEEALQESRTHHSRRVHRHLK